MFWPREDRLLVSTANGPSESSISTLDLGSSPRLRVLYRNSGLSPVSGTIAMGGRCVVVADVSRGVSVRSAADGSSELSSLVLPGGRCISHAVGPDDATLVMGSDDGWIQAWDMHAAQPMALPCRVEGAVHAVAFSPDSTRFAEIGRAHV